MDDFEISERYDVAGEDIDGAEGEPDVSVMVWKRDFGAKTFMFTAVMRPDSSWVNVSEVIVQYEPVHSMGFKRGHDPVPE